MSPGIGRRQLALRTERQVLVIAGECMNPIAM